ncbi:MAG: TfoX/Sxy family protein [Gammaproteobacteria bacterium]
MAVTADYRDYVLEQVARAGVVTTRRMFGALGLYCDGLFFGLIDDDTLFFKAGETNRADYESRGMRQFMPWPDKPDASKKMAYFEVPADVLEDAEQLVVWAGKSVAVALSASYSKKPKARRR